MKNICLLLFIFVSIGNVFARQDDRRTAGDSSAIRYLQSVGEQSMLYYGKEQESQPYTDSHPYLSDWKFTKSRLSYAGVVYPEAMLRFDMYRDELIVVSPDYHQIVLTPENVDFAELHDSHIIYFHHDSLPGSPSSGYFFLLHAGACRVLKKQIITMKYNDRSQPVFESGARYYLFMDGVYYPIRNRNGLLKVLHPYKKELKRFMASQRLRFRHHAGTLIAATVDEYEKLAGRP